MAGCMAKIIIFVVNFIFLLCGIAIMVFGIVTLSSPTTVIDALSYIPGYENFNYIIDVPEAVLSGGIVMTVLGSVLVVICVFGIAASCSSKNCLLGTYIGMILVVLYFEIGVIIYFSIDSQFVESKIQGLMYTSLVQNFLPVQIIGNSIVNGSTDGAVAWESMQFKYACCGAHGYEDYATFPWQANFTYNHNATVPPSCCQQISQYNIPTQTTEIIDLNVCLVNAPNYVNTKGCYTALSQIFFIYGYVKMISLSGLIAIEVFVLMFSCRLIHLNERESTGSYM